jgi:hypothetical protein
MRWVLRKLPRRRNTDIDIATEIATTSHLPDPQNLVANVVAQGQLAEGRHHTLVDPSNTDDAMTRPTLMIDGAMRNHHPMDPKRRKTNPSLRSQQPNESS